jgi:hypothetical protein
VAGGSIKEEEEVLIVAKLMGRFFKNVFFFLCVKKIVILGQTRETEW